MFIYEVNLSVKKSIAERYLSWLKLHVKEMLKFEGFLHATIANEIDEQCTIIKYSVRYSISNESFYKKYCQDHANKMRAEADRKFSNKFSVVRKTYKIITSCEKPKSI